jgi:hypothetical protein
MVQVATPAELRACEPPEHRNGTPSLLNVTLPAGVPVPGVLRRTVVVQVTA